MRAAWRRCCGAVVLAVLAGCAIPPERRATWLQDLAGRCWRQLQLQIEVCYWRDERRTLRFLSRDAEVLLGCGRFSAAEVTMWDDEARLERQAVQIDARALHLVEPGAWTVQLRPRGDLYRVRRGAEQLVFELAGAYRADGAARACTAFESAALTKEAEVP